MRSARLCSCEHDSDCCTWFCANTPSSLWTVRTKLTRNPNVPTHQRKAYVQVKAPQCHRHGGTHQQFIMFIYCFTSVWGRWGGGGGIHQTSIDSMTVLLIPDQEHPVSHSSHVANYKSSNQKTKVRFTVKVQVSLCLKSQALDFTILSTANTFVFKWVSLCLKSQALDFTILSTANTFVFKWPLAHTMSLPQAHATKPLHLDRFHESVQEWLTDGYNSMGRQVWLVVSIYVSIYQAWMNSQRMCKITSNTYKLACIWRQKARVSDQQRPLAKPEWMAQKRAMLSKRAYPTN